MSTLKFDIVGDNKNIIKALDGTRAGIKATAKEAEQAGMDMDAIFRKIGSAAATIGLGFSATKLISDVVRVRGEIQSLQKSFDVLAGAKGGELFEQIKEFAVKTPMDMPELAKGAQTLMAFNTEAEEVMPILKTMGDIAMGNKDKFQSLILAFSQMRSSGKLMGQDLMQMINAGFNPLSVMSEQTGKSVGQLKEEMSKGAISAEMVTKAFMDATAEGGKFHGMLETMSGGVEGMKSNLEGAITDMLNAIGEKTQGVITGTMSVATQLVENYEEVGRAIGLVATAYGSYKAVLMAVNAYTTVQHNLEKKHLAETLASKSAELDADLASAVAKGTVTQARAMEVQVLRNELKEKLQVAVVNDRIAQSELQTATIKYQNNLKDIGLSKLRVKQAQQELLAAQATGNAERINNAQMELSNAQKQKHLAIQESSILKRNMEAASATAEATAEARVVAAKNAETLSTGQLIKKELALAAARAKAALANPYVLAAAAAAALAVGIYAVVTAKSAEEKAIERVNKLREQENKKIEEQKDSINSLLGVINDDTQTKYSQKKAYEDLAKVMPELTNELSLEALQVMSAAEQTKKLNEALEAIKINNAKTQIEEYKRLFGELVASEGNWYNLSLETREALRNIFGNDWKPNIKEAMAFLQKEVENSKAVINDYNENAKPLSVKIEDAQKAADNAKVAFEAAKKALEDEQKRYEQEKEKYGWTIPVRFDIQQAYDNAKSEMQQTDANLQKLQGQLGKGDTSGGNYAKAFNKAKKEWEDADKALQDAINNRGNYTVEQYNQLVAKEQEAANKFKNLGGDTSKNKPTDDTAKNEERAGEILLDIMKKNNRDKIALQHEGDELLKKQIELDYQDRLAEIAKQEEEVKKLQGGKLTTEQQAAFQESRDIATQQRDKELQTVDENAKEKQQSELEGLLNDYLTYEQEREKIQKEYAEKRKKMQEAGAGQENIDLLNQEEAETLSATDEAFAQKSSTYRTWLNEITTLTLEELEKALLDAESALATLDQEGASEEEKGEARARVATLRGKVQNMKEKGSLKPEKRAIDEWRNFAESLEESASAFDELGSSIGGIAGEILGTVGSVASSTVSMINNITQLTQMSIKGTEETAETSSQAVKGVEKASVILAIISAVVQIIKKIVELATKMHDGKYEKVIEENQEKIDSLEKSYEKLEEAVDAAFGSTAVQGLKEMNENLEYQNRLIQEQKEAEEEKKKTDESAMQGYDDAMDENRKQIEENRKAMEEAIFGSDIQSAIENFADAYADAVADNMDLNESAAEQAKKAMKDMVMESIKEYVAGSNKMQAIRDKMQALYADGVFDTDDQKTITRLYEELNKEIDDKFAWAEDILSGEEESSSESSGGRGIATASQESVDENNGRLMSIQLSMSDITTQLMGVTMNLANITRVSVENNSVLSDIRSLHVQSNGFLEDLVKYTKPLNDSINSVVEQLKKL